MWSRTAAQDCRHVHSVFATRPLDPWAWFLDVAENQADFGLKVRVLVRIHVVPRKHFFDPGGRTTTQNSGSSFSLDLLGRYNDRVARVVGYGLAETVAVAANSFFHAAFQKSRWRV